jgi:hypothetical protein
MLEAPFRAPFMARLLVSLHRADFIRKVGDKAEERAKKRRVRRLQSKIRQPTQINPGRTTTRLQASDESLANPSVGACGSSIDMRLLSDAQNRTTADWSDRLPYLGLLLLGD